MDLISAIKHGLDQVAPQLGAEGSRPAWTTVVHRSIEQLASRYADANGWTVGWKSKMSTKECMTLEVYRTGGKPGQFLFDQCWLRFHRTDGSDDISFPETGEPKDGYLIGCDLAVETEWYLPKDDMSRVEFHRDFLKLVVGNATKKLFVFRCDEFLYENTMRELKTQLVSAKRKAMDETYLISCFRTDQDRFLQRVYGADGIERS